MGYLCALMFQRHRARYGVTEEQLRAIAVAQHRWAQLNPLAFRGHELTIEQYLAEPYYINPIRQSDVAPFDDGGVAMIVTRAAVVHGHRPRRLPDRQHPACIRRRCPAGGGGGRLGALDDR
jgi:acetyl-CoA acetyltransferase